MKLTRIGLMAAAAVAGPALGQTVTTPYQLIVHWSDIHQSTEYTHTYSSKDECELARAAVIAEQHRKLIFKEDSSSSPRGTVVIVPGTAPYTVCIPVG